eukprot:2517469-Alexandrium_andersonii.AAC.1
MRHKVNAPNLRRAVSGTNVDITGTTEDGHDTRGQCDARVGGDRGPKRRPTVREWCGEKGPRQLVVCSLCCRGRRGTSNARPPRGTAASTLPA